jgi:hypothetical protein
MDCPTINRRSRIKLIQESGFAYIPLNPMECKFLGTYSPGQNVQCSAPLFCELLKRFMKWHTRAERQPGVTEETSFETIRDLLYDIVTGLAHAKSRLEERVQNPITNENLEIVRSKLMSPLETLNEERKKRKINPVILVTMEESIKINLQLLRAQMENKMQDSVLERNLDIIKNDAKVFESGVNELFEAKKINNQIWNKLGHTLNDQWQPVEEMEYFLQKCESIEEQQLATFREEMRVRFTERGEEFDNSLRLIAPDDEWNKINAKIMAMEARFRELRKREQ